MISPKVSVIIPVYNSQKYLEETIDSVLHQTMQDFEIICIDDGSTDDSGIILKKYAEQDTRIKVLSQTNCGVSAARNAGTGIARGEYLYFLDSDDFIELETLETACRELDNKCLDVVFFDTYAFGEEGISQDFVNEKNKFYVRNSEYPAIYTGEELLLKLLDNHDYNCTVWMQMIRRDFQQKHNLWFYSGIIHEDELYTLQMMMLAKRAAYIHHTLHHRRLRKNSIITKPLEFGSVYGYFICVKEAYGFLIQQGCSKNQLEQLLLLLRSKIEIARSQFIKLSEKEKTEYERLPEQDKFLFQISLADYANIIIQRNNVSGYNNTLLREKESLNKKLSEAQIKLEQLRKYETARIDIKNFRTHKNSVIINHCTDETARIESPDWLKYENGSGVVIHSAKKEVDFEIQCYGDGELVVDFRGMDCRDKNGKRYPVWINLTDLNVDGKSVFNNSHLVCHDSPFKYNMAVTDGQRVKVHLEWEEAKDLIAKERETKLKLLDQAQQKVINLEKINAEIAKKLGDTQQKVITLEKVNVETAKKLGDTQQKVVTLEKVNVETAKKLGDTQQKVVTLEKEKSKVIEKLEKTQSSAAKLANELSNVKNGWSFRIGRVVTWIPRKIKGFLK